MGGFDESTDEEVLLDTVEEECDGGGGIRAASDGPTRDVLLSVDKDGLL